MNSPRFVTLSRLLTAVGFVVASAAVQAGGNNNVYWSVNVDAPTQGNGRLSSSFSNTRGGMYREPSQVVYAPQPVVIQAPGRVYYREPNYGRGDHWRHQHQHYRPGARVVRNVHNGLARLHQDIANFHEARADAWNGRRDGYYGRDDRRGYRDERRGGYYDR
jgi:hypothetical protein